MARPGSADRLVRLLALAAWISENDGATFEEAAAHFGVSIQTIQRDALTLWVSGLPGGMPEDLLDFSATDFEEGRLSLTEPLGLDRPVRLSRQEAVSLLLSLRVLGNVLADDPSSAAALNGARAALTEAVRNGREPTRPQDPGGKKRGPRANGATGNRGRARRSSPRSPAPCPRGDGSVWFTCRPPTSARCARSTPSS